MTLYSLFFVILLFNRGFCDFSSHEQTDEPPVPLSDSPVTPKPAGIFSFIDSLLSDLKKPTTSDDDTQSSDAPISPFDGVNNNDDGALIIKMNVDSGENKDGNSGADVPNAPNTDSSAISNSDEMEEKVITVPLLPQQQQNTTLENFFNRILDHLDSIFDFSQKKPVSDVDSLATPGPDEIPAPESSEEKLPLVDSTTAKPDDDSFSDSFGETFKTVTEESVPAPEIFVIASNDKDLPSDIDRSLKSDADTSDPAGVIIGGDSDDGSVAADAAQPRIAANISGDAPSENPTQSPPVASSEESGEKVPLSQALDGGLVDSYVDPVFCRAKCIQMCMADNNNDFAGCRAVCVASSLKDLCALEDTPCQKACGSTPINEELSAPNVTNVKYYRNDQVVDAETLEISWDPLPGAVVYIISLIPDSRSAQSGSFIVHQDFSNVPFYSFKKRDICFAYYARVSAVYADGITPYSQPVFADRAWANGFPNIVVEQGDLGVKSLMINQFSSVEFVEINLHLFSNLMLDFTKVQLSSYVLASGCQNPAIARSVLATPQQLAAMPAGDADGKVLVRNVQFLYLPLKIVVRLPVEYVTLNCNYEFRIALLRTKCGEIISFVSRIGFTFDSKVGVDFKVGCDTVAYSGCGTLLGSEENNPIAPVPQPDASNSVEDQSGTTPADAAPIRTKNCNMSGFSVDVIGNPIDNFNITLLWDNVQDGRPKTYVVRHGRVARRFIKDSAASESGVYDDDDSETVSDDPDLVIPDDGNSDLSPKSVKLNRPLTPTELHQVRVCVFYDGETLSDADWSAARRYTIDMAAFPQPVLAIDPPAFDGDVSSPGLNVLKLNKDDDQIAPWSKAQIDRPISPIAVNNDDDQIIWYRRLYFVQYNQAYWFYSSLIAFLLLLAASLFCFWVCRCCLRSGKKIAVDAKRRTPPMIFVARNDSMKQQILPEEKAAEKKEQIPPV